MCRHLRIIHCSEARLSCSFTVYQQRIHLVAVLCELHLELLERQAVEGTAPIRLLLQNSWQSAQQHIMETKLFADISQASHPFLSTSPVCGCVFQWLQIALCA